MLKPLAIIFDLDGVLINTVEAHFLGWVAVAKELGVPFSRSDNDRLRGVSRKHALAWLTQKQEALEQKREAYLLDLKARIYREQVERTGESIKIRGVDELLTGLRALRIPIGVASASRHAKMLLELTALTQMIDVISDGNFHGHLKPHPEQLFYLAARLAVDPSACVVVEDSDVGLEAARMAGMRCIAIGDASLAEGNVTGRLPSLDSVSVQEFLSLIECHP